MKIIQRIPCIHAGFSVVLATEMGGIEQKIERCVDCAHWDALRRRPVEIAVLHPDLIWRLF